MPQELSPLSRFCFAFILSASTLPVHEFMEILAVDAGKQDSLQCVRTRPCCGWVHLNARSNSIPDSFLNQLLPSHTAEA